MNRKRNRKLAQSASELAIFGAILVFVIGLIIRQGVNQSHHTNIRLRAMRMALNESYRTAEGQYYIRMGTGRFVPSAGRNTASVLVIEDRLSVDMADKYSTRDRAPFTASGTGSFSRNLFMPVDWDETWNLPVYDVFINGQRFPFSLARFVTINIDESHPFWEPECIDVGTPLVPDIRGCAIFYTKIFNFPNSEHEWCWEDPCSENMDVDGRFDLDRDGSPDDGPQPGIMVPCGYSTGGAIVECPLREVFNWQWYKIAGVHHSVRDRLVLDGAGNPRNYPGVNPDKNVNIYADVDGDGHDEQIYKIRTLKEMGEDRGIIISMDVLDNEAGDLNFSGDRLNAKGRQAGLREDVFMYSFTRDGTVLEIREGKLYGPTNGQFVRHTNRQEHADIIMRIFDLSNNTGRFCHLPPLTGPVDWSGIPGLMGLKNPVEACDNCFTTNIEKTCMMPEELIIFVRSRIRDLRGNRWVTRFVQE